MSKRGLNSDISNFIFVLIVVILWLCPLCDPRETSCNSHTKDLVSPGAPPGTSAARRLHNDRLLLSGVEPGVTREIGLGGFRLRVRSHRHFRSPTWLVRRTKHRLWPQLDTRSPLINNVALDNIVPCCESGLMGKHQTSQEGECVAQRHLLMGLPG